MREHRWDSWHAHARPAAPEKRRTARGKTKRGPTTPALTLERPQHEDPSTKKERKKGANRERHASDRIVDRAPPARTRLHGIRRSKRNTPGGDDNGDNGL